MQAAGIIRRAADAAEAMLVYAPDREFLICDDAGDGPNTELTLAALTKVQRHAAQANGPVAFNLVGQGVEDFTGALSDDQREFLAFSVPTTESAAEMCILGGAWERKARTRVLRFMESATPALTVILERLLNADRGQRLAQQLHTLANAAQILTRSGDVKVAVRDLATAISAATGFEYLVNIDMYDATTGRFFLRIMSEQRHTTGVLAEMWEASLNPDRPDPWDVEVMTSLKPAFRPDMQNDPVYPEHVRKFYARALLRSAADFPLLFQDEFLGMMAFVSYKTRTFPPEEVSLLQGLVSQAAMALTALQMHKEVERFCAQEIKRSADQYIATANLTGDIIARLDEHGNWAFLNNAACQFYGKPREELLGTEAIAALHPEDVERTVQAVEEARASKEPIEGFVNRLVTPTGTRVVEWNAYPICDEDGHYAGLQMIGRDITRRRQAEEELRQSEEKYRRLVQDSTDGIAIVQGLEVRFVNRALLRMYGGESEEEMVGHPLTDFVAPEHRELMVKRSLAREKGRNVSAQYEFKALRKDGTKFDAELSVSLISHEGRVARQGVIRDITARRQMEDALRESERRYRLLAENATDVIWTMNLNFRYTYVSSSVTRMRGYTPEEIVGTSVRRTMTPASLDVAWKTLAEQLAIERMRGADPNRSVKVDLEMYCKDGSTTWTETNVTPIRDSDGKPNGILGVTRDISERKRMEEALRESQRRYRLLAEATADVVWTMDLSLRYTYISPAITHMRGYTVEEIMGLSAADTMTPASLEVTRKAFAEQLAIERTGNADPNRSFKVELEMYCKDGSTIWTEMNTKWLRDSDGKLNGILGVTRDISERKRAEEERARLQAELEVRATTDGLTGLYNHAHFYQRLAEELDRSKRYNHSFAVVMMDVDNFKLFNDSYGHQAGDEMLRLIADGIRPALRRSDIAFRYGGDEFAAILPHADSKKAQVVVNRINRRVTKSLKQMDGDIAARLSLSAGVACFPDDETTADDLVKAADVALYSAKSAAGVRSASETIELATATTAKPS